MGQRKATKGNIPSKKFYWFLAGITLIFIFSDSLLHLVGEAVFLSLETLEMSVDTMFEELFHLAPESSQLATAWTGATVFVILLVWIWKKLKKLNQRFQNGFPGWWIEQKKEFYAWWNPLPGPLKLAHYVGGMAIITILTLSLFF
jgi:hypothetical protein